jgi:hypothetical protein
VGLELAGLSRQMLAMAGAVARQQSALADLQRSITIDEHGRSLAPTSLLAARLQEEQATLATAASAQLQASPVQLRSGLPLLRPAERPAAWAPPPATALGLAAVPASAVRGGRTVILHCHFALSFALSFSIPIAYRN